MAGNSQTSPYVTVAGCVVRALVKASHPEPAVAVTAVTALLAWGVGHRSGRHRARSRAAVAGQPTRDRLGQRLARRRPRPGGRPHRQAGRHGRDRPSYGRHLRRRWPRWPASCLALFLGRPAGASDDLGAGVRPALRLAAEAHRAVRRCRTRSRSACCPAFVVTVAAGLAGARRSGWSRPARCSGAGAHFANVLPDLDDDARTGVRGLPHRLGAARSAVAAAGLLLAATVTLVFGPPGAAVVGRHRRDRARPSWCCRSGGTPAGARPPGCPAGRGLPGGDGGGAHRRRPARDS